MEQSAAAEAIKLDFRTDSAEESCSVGLTSDEALRRLLTAIATQVDAHRFRESWRGAVDRVVTGRSRYSWRKVWLQCAAVSVALVAAAAVLPLPEERQQLWHAAPSGASLAVAAALVTIVALLSLALSVCLERCFYSELLVKIRSAADHVQSVLASLSESECEMYPQLEAHPSSGCASVHRGYRDGRPTQIPVSLLVDGDVILLRPGQVSMVSVVASDNCTLHLQPGEVFPAPAASPGPSAAPTVQLTPVATWRKFIVQQPACWSSLSLALSEGCSRPEPRLWRGAREVISLVVWLTVVVSLLMCVLGGLVRWWLSAPPHVALAAAAATAADCALCVLALVPLPLATLLVATVLWSDWCLTALSSHVSAAKHDLSPSQHQQQQPPPPLQGCVDVMDEERSVWPSTAPSAGTWRALLVQLWRGGRARPSLPLSASLTHALATVTSVCCVDQLGVLSWPCPGVEKVATLRRDNSGATASSSSGATASSDELRLDVLTLSADSATRGRLQFDDPDWSRALSRLKPLGLAAMIGLCHSHHQPPPRHCASQLSPASLCMSQLWRAIGFSATAGHALVPLSRLTVKWSGGRRGRLDRAISSDGAGGGHTVEAVFVRDTAGGGEEEGGGGDVQLITVGDCELLTSQCSEFWDGAGLAPLHETGRRRLLDFCRRHALLSHCVAFAYRPTSGAPSARLDGESQLLLTGPLAPLQVDCSCQLGAGDGAAAAGGGGEAERLRRLVSDQVALGAVTLQYQVLPDVVLLVDRLERACVRFVHFSQQNELRSRVFSEKMGLESGWNCHISLRDEPSPSPLPCAVALAQQPQVASAAAAAAGAEGGYDSVGGDNMSVSGGGAGGGSSSSSCDDDDETVALIYDVNNRAKLPKGIAQVLPHLEHVDNVPLQVSLFTDCSPHSARQMLAIMQQYDEVVCVLGSAASWHNTPLYLQADTALATRPLAAPACPCLPHHQQLQQQQQQERTVVSSEPQLVAVARRLDTLACSLVTERGSDDLALLWQLILEARHWTERARLALILCLGVTSGTALMLALAALCQLPAPLSPAHTLFLCWVLVPMLAVSLLLGPRDPSLISEPPRRPAPLQWRQLPCFWRLVGFYSARFGPGCLVPLLFLYSAGGVLECGEPDCGAWLLAWLQGGCLLTATAGAAATTVSLLHRNTPLLTHWAPCGGAGPGSVCCAAPAAVLLLLLLTLAASWVFVLLHCWLLHAPLAPLLLLAPHLAVSLGVWPVLQLLLCETVKRLERKHYLRSQKRARLDFDTKLGMNSPF